MVQIDPFGLSYSVRQGDSIRSDAVGTRSQISVVVSRGKTGARNADG